MRTRNLILILFNLDFHAPVCYDVSTDTAGREDTLKKQIRLNKIKILFNLVEAKTVFRRL